MNQEILEFYLKLSIYTNYEPYEEYYLVYDPHYYNEGYPGGGGGTSTPSGPSASQTDGVDITNSNNFKINTDISPVFTTQLTRILTSNSVIKKMLNYFDNGHVRLNIGIEKLKDPDAGAETSHNSDDVENYYMNFNSRFITDNGWVVNNNEGTDNIGFDWSQVKTKEEALLVTLAHEAIHAQYYALFYDFYYLNEGKPFRTWRYFTEHGYPKEFIDIFIKDDKEHWYSNDEIDSRMHEYMRKNDRQRIQDALNEYRNDFP